MRPIRTAQGTFIESLSARRAWIEIGIEYQAAGQTAVSLSARRAWIEIDSRLADFRNPFLVALRKEGVD